MLSEAKQGPDAKQAGQDRRKAQGPKIAAQEGLRKKDRVKVQRPMVVGRVVAEVAQARHLIRKPSVDPLVEMRGL
jgi:hypothetical protein